ncbi:hypothetical protein VSS74_03940 [Conexibacter stalactiti]|uniref:Ig-like domain-containing protein n=1 Tax=Conexibacter stalactiti TaxID=1940611 RepID=A0ABU4HL82_9ACTN|nr:hypothetical protein [Conexibacter stalactiti]MDW5593474.1 hypothetical protein [Conexibacter stalactiti]MEC5034115.1 hypothetical protein [Conexibacter stalactiti]
MRQIRGFGTLVGVVATSAAVASTAATAQLPVGPPINFVKPIAIELGTYEVLPLRAPDPRGGLPWGMATYSGKPRDGGEFRCSDFGRLQGGRIGIVTAENTFRPYEPAGGLDTRCGGVNPRTGQSGYMVRAVPETLPANCDVPSTPSPAIRCSDPTGPFRTVISGELGPGILSATTTVGGRERRVPLTPNGEFITVFDGTYTETTLPAIHLVVSTCGANARFDLSGRGMVKDGCRATMDFPADQPVRESAASRRARRAPRVSAHLRVIERRGAASTRRFTARLTVPITVRVLSEGYAYELSGPTGKDCRARTTRSAGEDYVSNYRQIAGKRYDAPIMPLRGRWCPGRYELTFFFVRQTGSTPGRLLRKQIATTSFTVT